MSAEWVEDKRYVLTSIDDLKKDVKDLKDNDNRFSTTLAVLSTKMVVYGIIANSIVGSIIAFVMNLILGGK